MTVPATAATGGADRFRALLPAHLWARDDQSGGTLQALLSAVAAELDLLEQDLEDLYDGWFAETCDEWILPYLADLIGLTEPLPDLGDGFSWRALVADTLSHRRRKGTAAALGRIAAEATGGTAWTVEYYRLLAVSAHVQHPRPDRPATASLRAADRLDHVGAGHDRRRDRSTPPPDLIDPARGAFDPLARCADVRSIGRGRGRYNIPSLGVVLLPLRTYRVGPDPDATTGGERWSQPRPVDGWYRMDPLGRSIPLFPGAPSADGTDPADEDELPVPVRPRRLLAMLTAARRGELDPERLPLGVRILPPDAAGPPTELGPERVRVCGLEDLADLPGPQVGVDAVTGRLRTYQDGRPAEPADLLVRYHYAALADVGAGPYDRSAVHARVLAADGHRDVLGVITVRADAEPSPDDLVVTSVADGLALAEQLWHASASPAGTTVVVAVGDSTSHRGDLAVTLPADARLVLVAAARPERGRATAFYTPDGLRPHLGGPLAVTGAAGSSLLLDGFLLDGDLTVRPGDLGALTVAQCTLDGRIMVAADTTGDNGRTQVALVRGIARAVELADGVPALTVTESVIDAGQGPAAVSAPGARVTLDGSTVRGDVTARTIDGANTLIDGTATAEQRQTGCLRYCYARPGSQLPRRFRCAPPDGGPPVEPVYVSTDPGSPYYLALAPTCPSAIAQGGEHGAEMGVHHHLRRPLRREAARRHLAAYVPAGLEIGIIGS
ncbi:phage tail protein [Kitasatospora sp. NPDC087314]|uniref:phage tail protein n=1 Tax=Kitasatospora sp. NPDC087314 TaxID=3364068 RepID=UPI003807D38A